MWGIIPAAGAGSGIQPLAFSKELLPVGNREIDGRKQPRAVSEYLVERMILGGANKLCFVIAPNKTDILEYYGTRTWGAEIAYVAQAHPAGLCDAIFRAAPFIHPSEPVMVGLPDTIWHPVDALTHLPDQELSFLLFPVENPEFFDAVSVDDGGWVQRIHVKEREIATHLPDQELSFLLFPVENPELFDAVSIDDGGWVQRIHVKQREIATHWVWGAFKMPGVLFHELHRLWQQPGRRDEYFGTLVNAWLDQGGRALGICAGTSYIDTGTLNGYRTGMHQHNEVPHFLGDYPEENSLDSADANSEQNESHSARFGS